MKKSSLSKMSESLNKVTNDWNSFLLWKFDSLFDESFQISLIAKFSDNVTVVSCAINIMTFENVGMI